MAMTTSHQRSIFKIQWYSSFDEQLNGQVVLTLGWGETSNKAAW
jgi:hypothetical protein